MSPSDPFCAPTGGSSDPDIGGYFCAVCKQGDCVAAELGERGKDESCTVVTDGMRVVSCTTAGNACNGIAAVTP